MNQSILRAGYDKSRTKSRSGFFYFGIHNVSDSVSRSISRVKGGSMFHNNKSYSTSASGNWVRSWSKSLSFNRAFSKSGDVGAFPVKTS